MCRMAWDTGAGRHDGWPGKGGLIGKAQLPVPIGSVPAKHTCGVRCSDSCSGEQCWELGWRWDDDTERGLCALRALLGLAVLCR